MFVSFPVAGADRVDHSAINIDRIDRIEPVGEATSAIFFGTEVLLVKLPMHQTMAKINSALGGK